MRKKKRGFEDTRKWYRYQFFGNATVTAVKENVVFSTTIANISLSGIGLYSPVPIGKGKKVEIKVSFINRHGKAKEDITTGVIDWQTKFKKNYLLGIIFDEELNTTNQPNLIEHLMWLINTYNWPQPYKDKRIATL
jgi:PilZ domain